MKMRKPLQRLKQSAAKQRTLAAAQKRKNKMPVDTATSSNATTAVDEEGPEAADLSKLSDKDVRNAAMAATNYMQKLSNLYFERDSEIEGMMLALLTKHHCLFIGPHGLAKSELARTAFNSIEKPSIFEVELTKFDTLDVLFGPIDIDRLRSKSEYQHNCTGMLPSVQLAILEEIFDASRPVLRSALQVLNERKFTRGQFNIEDCPLHTCVATSNFYDEDDPALKAVIDRFMIRAEAKPIQESANRIKMYSLKRTSAARLKEENRLSWSDIQLLHKTVMEDVNIDDETLELYDQTMFEFNAKMGSKADIPPVLDRRARNVVRLLKANALMHGRMDANPQDILAARFGFCVLNRAKDEQAFADVFKKVVGNRAVRAAAMKEVSDMEKVIRNMRKRLETTKDKNVISTLYTDLRAFIRSIEHDGTVREHKEAQVRIDKVMSDAKKLLDEVQKANEKK